MNLKQWLSSLEDIPEKVAVDIAKDMVKEAQRISPVNTGKLKAGWGYRLQKQGSGYSIILTNTQEYAQYQHPDIGQQVLDSIDINLSQYMKG